MDENIRRAYDRLFQEGVMLAEKYAEGETLSPQELQRFKAIRNILRAWPFKSLFDEEGRR
jgi:hypothetical protein